MIFKVSDNQYGRLHPSDSRASCNICTGWSKKNCTEFMAP